MILLYDNYVSVDVLLKPLYNFYLNLYLGSKRPKIYYMIALKISFSYAMYSGQMNAIGCPRKISCSNNWTKFRNAFKRNVQKQGSCLHLVHMHFPHVQILILLLESTQEQWQHLILWQLVNSILNVMTRRLKKRLR